MPRFRRLALLVICCLLLPATALDARASVDGVPDLRLIRTSESVRLIRYGRGPVVLDLHVYMAAFGAPFEIRARRATYDDPIRAWQVLHGSGDPRSIRLPDDLIDGWSGLADLFEVDVRSLEGVPIRHKTFSFCPNSYEVVRVSDTGPLQPDYPYGCGRHPFTMGAVWGVDEGWAVPTLSWERPMTIRLRDGTYIATISVAPRYVDLFGMAPEEATAEVQIRVVTRKGCCGNFATRDTAPPRAGRLGPASSPNPRQLTPVATVNAPDPATVPDLVALPSFGISPVSQRGRDFLAFGANVWNRGPAPLLVEGFRRPGEDSMEAFQYFTRRGRVVGKAPVGTFHFHRKRGHYHWHFEHFAGYRLLDVSGTQAVRSRKQSFCLAPTDPIDTTVRGATWRPDELGFSACGGPEALWIRETLPVGWGDTYFQYVAGQSFDITDLPNGTYFIEVRANPLGLLHDRDASNDTVVREVILGGVRGSRTATVPPWHGIDSEGGFGIFG